MERLAATTRSSPPCGVVFTPRPCASKRPSNSRLYARSAKRLEHSESGAKLRSAVLGSFAGVALSFGVFVGGGHAEEVSMTSPFQGLQEMRERNQKKLDAAEESFQNSDILKELKAKSEANRSANKKAIENKYCYRQAEMGVGDCGGLRFIEGGKLKLLEGATTTGILFDNPPEFLKQIFGNFFNDLKEIIAPAVEEDLEEEVAAFEAELAETVKAVEVIEAEIIAEPAKPVESAKPSPEAEPVKPAEPVEEKKESTEAPEPVKAPVKETAEPEVSKEAVEPVKAADPVEEKKESTVAAEPVKSPEAVVEPEQPKESSVEPEKSTEAVEVKQSTEPAEPAKVTEVVETAKSTEAAEPVQVAEVVEVSVKSAEPIAEPVEVSKASEPAE